ncbi:hypothetical protein G3I60_32925 [Streptomyces sp. SID13666]|uniref:hypothetical protein n=1 Tax=unclassified Streptomyces TaxID=2593676 RepID=UPI0013BFD7B6|nr:MULTISPECIES: hypothetical protein [unclassified Streptomyces]NEA58834.1 hypothetical protein [Streptomyces sp. SID13666]NEA74537.1 hypothetical protein [Streptomyces sp. SID13588]
MRGPAGGGVDGGGRDGSAERDAQAAQALSAYRHASGAGSPYHFKATVTWKIGWTGTGNPKPVDLPDGTFGTTTDLTVREIQAVVR